MITMCPLSPQTSCHSQLDTFFLSHLRVHLAQESPCCSAIPPVLSAAPSNSMLTWAQVAARRLRSSSLASITRAASSPSSRKLLHLPLSTSFRTSAVPHSTPPPSFRLRSSSRVSTPWFAGGGQAGRRKLWTGAAALDAALRNAVRNLPEECGGTLGHCRLSRSMHLCPEAGGMTRSCFADLSFPVSEEKVEGDF